LNQPNENKAVN